MIVVSDTPPILNLCAVGQLPLLRQLYVEIVIPPAVRQELSSWVRVVAANDENAVKALRAELDPGEAEAIVVASEIHAGFSSVTKNLVAVLPSNMV